MSVLLFSVLSGDLKDIFIEIKHGGWLEEWSFLSSPPTPDISETNL